MKGKVKVRSLSRVQLLATPWTAAYRLLRPWDSPGKSTGVGCHRYFYLYLKLVKYTVFPRGKVYGWYYNFTKSIQVPSQDVL